MTETTTKQVTIQNFHGGAKGWRVRILTWTDGKLVKQETVLPQRRTRTQALAIKRTWEQELAG